MTYTLDELLQGRCVPLKGTQHQLPQPQVESLLALLPQWTLDADRKSLVRRFAFPDFYDTMAFVNALAWVAHRQDHHPDLAVGYGYCEVRFTTHDVGGLSLNDFICAAQTERLV